MDRKILFAEAQQFQKKGHYDNALNIYLKILNDFNDINALHNVGVIYFIKKEYFKAEKYLWYSIKDGLHESYFVENFIKVLKATKQYKYALHLIKNNLLFKQINKNVEIEIIELMNIDSSSYKEKEKDNYNEIDINLRILIKEQKFKEALNMISLQIHKKEIKYILVQGAIYLKMRKPFEALKCYKLCLEIEPNNIEANLNYASANIILGNYELSEKLFRKVLSIDKSNIDAYRNLIIIKSMTGKLEEGIILGQVAVQENVNDDQLLSDLATNYSKLNNIIEAERLFDKSLALNSSNHTTLCNYGGHLEKNGRRRDAKLLLERSLLIKPMASTYNNLGMIYMSICEVKKSIEYFNKALFLEESFQLAKSNKLFAMNYFYTNPIELYEQYTISNKNNNSIVTNNTIIKKSNDKKFNLGFISGDFNSHPVAEFIIEIIKRINKDKFNIILVSTNSLNDEITQTFKSICTKWLDIFSLNDLDAAKKISGCKIDLLIDLSGHSSHNRLGIFKFKPAYKTATWLGFNYTTGLTSIDYFLTDQHQVPEESKKYYSEKIKYISDHAFCFKPNSKFTEINILPFYNNKYITFGCASRSVRINDDVILAWSKILNSNQNYKLQINSISFADEYVCEIYRSKFEELGISNQQVSFDFYHYDKFLNEIDIMLDCFPHNSGTTLYESLYKGVPFITLETKISLGRLGAAILKELDLSDLIANTIEDYINIACQLANSINKLSYLRKNLRNMMQNSNLMNSIKFTQDFENSVVEIIN